MSTAPSVAEDADEPLSRLEELRLRLQLEQEAMGVEEFAGTVDLEAASLPVPRGRQRAAKPAWLKHGALQKTDPSTVQGQNYLRLKKDVRSESRHPANPRAPARRPQRRAAPRHRSAAMSGAPLTLARCAPWQG